jgi:hypothetical protein
MCQPSTFRKVLFLTTLHEWLCSINGCSVRVFKYLLYPKFQLEAFDLDIRRDMNKSGDATGASGISLSYSRLSHVLRSHTDLESAAFELL